MSNDLFECPACKGKVSVEAGACPKCGQPITGKMKDAAVKKQLQDKKNTKIGCLAIIILSVALVYMDKDK